ncbi:MAG: hypothetical protein R3Y35_13335 [Clostridia bacterium]
MEILGNIIGICFFLVFQVCGILIIFSVLNKYSFHTKLLTGSVLGSVMLMWFPCLFAFFIGFNTLSHILALILAILSTIFICYKFKFKVDFKTGKPNILVLSLSLFIYLILILLVLHSFRVDENAIYSSQCTFGDMNMHLGFITSIAKNETFPPIYSIFPLENLSYPFLCDSISSSIYLLGSSLQFAYFLPMFFAFAQVIAGFVLIMKLWLKDNYKVALALVLFFFNGGFGIYYFLNGSISDPDNFFRIFTAFYQTPTNYTSENISWVNIIVDMLIPQRATLFGWSVLFTCIALLLQKSKSSFIILGILAGALPLIHTHSFLVLAIVSACLLVCSVCKNCDKVIKCLLLVFPVFFIILQLLITQNGDYLLYISLTLVAVILVCGLVFAIKQGLKLKHLSVWGIYLAITLVLALPQLFAFTFTQSDGFVRGYFNWNNNGDNYLWFYLKNLGLMAILYYPAVIFAKKRSIKIASPIVIIMILSELIVFQPNVYDNNKLIYIAYLFLCGLVAELIIDKFKAKKIVLPILILLFTISAVLTICREFNASYELYGEEVLEFVDYIEENTETDDIFLTNDRHNNEISTLTGRSILCGSPSYLYYHGIDYSGVAQIISYMYNDPYSYYSYFEEFSVDYIVISAYETNSYDINFEAIDELFDLVYENGSIKLYKVK